MNPPLLEVTDLSVEFSTPLGKIYALNQVSFSLQAGETLGIVGESGSGKSVTCSALMRLLPENKATVSSGKVIFGGHSLLELKESVFSRLRGHKISYIFQDPMSTLNPYLSIGYQIMEPLLIHTAMSKKEAKKQALLAMEEVGIAHPEARFDAYPHEFSGGMRQRVVIAMALITRPTLLIADEPTTALDVTLQKQILSLIAKRQKELGTSLILISHDLGLVSHYADNIQVMYAGRIIEKAPTQILLKRPLHAYTKALLASRPQHQEKNQPLYTLPGLAPSLFSPPHECSFAPRNTLGKPELCLKDRLPLLKEVEPLHFVQDCPGCLA